MATLSDLGKRVRNTRNRLSSLFIWRGYYSSGYRSPVNFGRIINSSFTGEPVTSSKDQDGRESADLLNITVSFALLQTSSEELSLTDVFAIPPDRDDFENGHYIYVTGSKLSSTELNNATTGSTNVPDYTILGDSSNEPYDPDGLYFKNVFLKPSPDIDLSGGESTIGIEFTGQINFEQLKGLNDETKYDANHIFLGRDFDYNQI